MRNHDHHPSFAILRRIDTVLASLDKTSPARARRNVNAVAKAIYPYQGNASLHAQHAVDFVTRHPARARAHLEQAADWIIAHRG